MVLVQEVGDRAGQAALLVEVAGEVGVAEGGGGFYAKHKPKPGGVGAAAGAAIDDDRRLRRRPRRRHRVGVVGESVEDPDLFGLVEDGPRVALLDERNHVLRYKTGIASRFDEMLA